MYDFIRYCEVEYGHPCEIAGELYYYFAEWRRLVAEKERREIPHGDDVRAAGYVLDELGIPHARSWAECGDGGEWVIYWA